MFRASCASCPGRLVHHVQGFWRIMFRASDVSCAEPLVHHVQGSFCIMFRVSCGSCAGHLVHHVQVLLCIMFWASCVSCSGLRNEGSPPVLQRRVRSSADTWYRASRASCSASCSGRLVHHVQGVLCIMFRSYCASCSGRIVHHVQSFLWITPPPHPPPSVCADLDINGRGD